MIHCLHGAVGSHHNWNHLQTAFPGQTQAVDLWRLFDHAKPTLEEAGQIIAGQAAPGDVLLGYSMGGRLALHALLAEPEKWRAAIIVSAHPGLTEGHSDRLKADQKWSDLASQDWPRFLAQWNTQTILSDLPDHFQQATPTDAQAVAQSLRSWSLGQQQDLRPSFPDIICPMLWLTGNKDSKFTKLAKEVTPLIPNATHQIIPNCGHRLPWEEPAPFLEAVEKFLA